MSRCLLIGIALSACSFTVPGAPGDAGDVGEVGDARMDAPSDAASTSPVTRTFGERPNLDYAGVTLDTHVDQMFPSVLHGASVDMLLDGGPVSMGLIRFDVGVLSSTTVSVTSAELRVVTSGVQNNPRFAVREAIQPWNAASVWPGPSVGPSLGGPATSDPDTEYVIALPASLVERWIKMPATNTGVALTKTGGDDVFIHTCESAIPTARPSLSITFSP